MPNKPYEKTNYINVPITSSSFSLEIPATRDMTALWGLLENHEENDDEMEWLCKTSDFAERVLVNGDATIVFWADGTKTVVRWSGEEEYSVYHAFCSALAIKLYGSNSHLKKVLKAITQEQKSNKPKPVEPTEFMVGDYVRPKKHEVMTDGKWPRKVLEVDREDNTVKLSDFEEAWWEAGALELTEAPSPRNVFRVGEKVRLHDGLEVGDLYGGLCFSLNKKNIMEAVGGVATVIEADPKDNSYLLAGCGENTWYHGNMLELAE